MDPNHGPKARKGPILPCLVVVNGTFTSGLSRESLPILTLLLTVVALSELFDSASASRIWFCMRYCTIIQADSPQYLVQYKQAVRHEKVAVSVRLSRAVLLGPPGRVLSIFSEAEDHAIAHRNMTGKTPVFVRLHFHITQQKSQIFVPPVYV